MNHFSGYQYSKQGSQSGQNDQTEAWYSLNDLLGLESGYFGVKGGISGLLKLETGILTKNKFQYTSQDMSFKSNWINLENCRGFILWLLEQNHSPHWIDWNELVNTTLSSKHLFRISAEFRDQIYVGIRGGVESLKSMKPEEVKKKKWGISTIKSTAQWIDGKTFHDVLKENQVF